MNFSDKIVTRIPLECIWTEERELEATRASYLTSNDIGSLLKKSSVQFIVADCGCKLTWIDKKSCFNFWKNEAKLHIADNIDRFYLDDFIDNYAYIASLWTTKDDTPIILLEKYH